MKLEFLFPVVLLGYLGNVESLSTQDRYQYRRHQLVQKLAATGNLQLRSFYEQYEGSYGAYWKREYIAGSENGPSDLGLDSQEYDPDKSQAELKNSRQKVNDWIKNDKGQEWSKSADGKWQPNSPLQGSPTAVRQENIKELPGLVPGTKGEQRFNDAWKTTNKKPKGQGVPINSIYKHEDDQKRTWYTKHMAGPNAMHPQALNNYAKQMYIDGNKKAGEDGQKTSHMAASTFSEDPNGNRNIHMSLTTKGSKTGREATGPLVPAYQNAVDAENRLRAQHGKNACTHTTGGQCAEKGTSPFFQSKGSASAAYGTAEQRPGFRSDQMDAATRRSKKIPAPGTHPGCSGKDDQIGCDKVLQHNKVKDVNGHSPGTQDAQLTIPNGIVRDRINEIKPGQPFRLNSPPKSREPKQPWDQQVEQYPDDKAKERMKKTTELAQQREKEDDKKRQGQASADKTEEQKAQEAKILQEKNDAEVKRANQYKQNIQDLRAKGEKQQKQDEEYDRKSKAKYKANIENTPPTSHTAPPSPAPKYPTSLSKPKSSTSSSRSSSPSRRKGKRDTAALLRRLVARHIESIDDMIWA